MRNGFLYSSCYESGSTGPGFYSKTMVKNVLEPDIRIYCIPTIFLNI